MIRPRTIASGALWSSAAIVVAVPLLAGGCSSGGPPDPDSTYDYLSDLSGDCGDSASDRARCDGLDPTHLQDALNAADTDGDGQVSREEFTAAHQAHFGGGGRR